MGESVSEATIITWSKNIGDMGQLFVDARASYGFNSIQIKDEYGESNIGGVIFSLGYAYTLQ